MVFCSRVIMLLEWCTTVFCRFINYFDSRFGFVYVAYHSFRNFVTIKGMSFDQVQFQTLITLLQGNMIVTKTLELKVNDVFNRLRGEMKPIFMR